jgi:hypothetical protein
VISSFLFINFGFFVSLWISDWKFPFPLYCHLIPEHQLEDPPATLYYEDDYEDPTMTKEIVVKKKDADGQSSSSGSRWLDPILPD